MSEKIVFLILIVIELSTGRQNCPWYKTKWEKVLCTDKMVYSDNTLEDVVINKNNEKLCINTADEPPPTPPTPPVVTEPPIKRNEWVLDMQRTPKPKIKVKCPLINGKRTCAEGYGKNTLEDLVIDQHKDTLCIHAIQL